MRIKIALEPLEAAWPEMEGLAVRQFAEVMRPLVRRKFVPDVEALLKLEKEGFLKLLTARKDERLIGYCTWMLTSDIESKGTGMASLGAWYVEPGNFGIGRRLFEDSIRFLQKFDVKVAQLHHWVGGRGHNLGRFFARQGARLVQHTYEMDL